MKSILIPRPIAWVGTVDATGTPNLAPHSFFTMASEEPPIVLFSSTTRKDTVANVEETGEFTISLVSRPLFEAANQTSAPYPREVSEFERAGLAEEDSALVAAPRAAASMTLRASPGSSSVDTDTLSTERGRTLPLADRLDPLARLGKNEWSALGEILTITRPGTA